MFVATTGKGRITNHKVFFGKNINIKAIVVLYNRASDKLLILKSKSKKLYFQQCDYIRLE